MSIALHDLPVMVPREEVIGILQAMTGEGSTRALREGQEANERLERVMEIATAGLESWAHGANSDTLASYLRDIISDARRR